VAGWVCHGAAGRLYILLTHTTALRSATMVGRGVTDAHRIIRGFLSRLDGIFAADGLSLIYEDVIARASGTLMFCKALNCSLSGSMKHLTKDARFLPARSGLCAPGVG